MLPEIIRKLFQRIVLAGSDELNQKNFDHHVPYQAIYNRTMQLSVESSKSHHNNFIMITATVEVKIMTNIHHHF